MANTDNRRKTTTQTAAPARKKSGCSGFIAKLIFSGIAVFFITTFMGICEDMEEGKSTGSGEQQRAESQTNETMDPYYLITGGTSSSEDSPADDAERLPNVPEDLRSNILLKTRLKGNCRSMTGDVMAAVIYLNDGESSWTEDAKNRMKQNNYAAADRQMEMAAEYGAELDISLLFCDAAISETITMDNFYLFIDDILDDANLPASERFSSSMKSLYDVDEATVFVYLNKPGRAFSVELTSSEGAEYSFFYEIDSDFCHEMNHVFGAVDYYSPAAIKNAAEKYWPNSIMLTGGETVMDPLNAYLVGWTDNISDEVLSFLQETIDVTSEQAANELEEELYTGYVENSRRGNGIYTGNLIDGAMDGYGSVIYDDGSSYEGDWKYGRFHGYGTFRWADGSSYTGEWSEGYMHGEGTLSWTDGNYYVGEMYQGAMHGQGTIYYTDGTTLSGTWENSEFVD